MDTAAPESPQTPHPWTTVTPLSKALALILFITLPIGMFFLGMYVQSQSQTSSQPTQAVAPTTAAVSPAPDETADRKTYTSQIERLNFKYPSEWKTGYEAKPSAQFSSEQLNLTSPNGLEFYYGASDIENQGGPPPQYTVYSVEKIDVPNFKALYLVKVGQGKNYRIGLTDKEVAVGNTTTLSNNSYLHFRGKTTVVSFTAGMLSTTNKMSTSLTQEAFFNLPDVKIAEKILRSVSY